MAQTRDEKAKYAREWRQKRKASIPTSAEGVPITDCRRDGKIRLARIAEQPLLTPEQVEKALVGYFLGSLRLSTEKVAALKLLGERFGLWGPGRKGLAPTPDEPKEQPFKVANEPSQTSPDVPS